jgi:high-affinity Fe2+/Pb2+ permease
MKNLFDRLTTALTAAIFGALLGAVMAWLFGAYSQTMGSSRMFVMASDWIFGGAALFAILGFVLKEDAGTIVGEFINAIFQFERADQSFEVGWVGALVALVIGAGIVWYFVS